jgi:hypothetical protein
MILVELVFPIFDLMIGAYHVSRNRIGEQRYHNRNGIASIILQG